jgi:recA bacterial DNA recombination protein
MKSAAQVRAHVEAALGPGFPSPFALRETRVPELVSSGFVAVDVLTGGLPRASLTEISGPPSSGRTALELALLASLTTQGEACALIDAEDALDPASAQAAGVVLDRLLWVRCHGLEQALRAADLLLGAGGFGAVVLDLADVPARRTRRVPLSYWFRFRRAVENTPTVLALIDEEPCAQSSASLVLRLEAESVEWSAAASAEIRNLKFEIRNPKLEIPNREHRNSKFEIRNSPILGQDPERGLSKRKAEAGNLKSLISNPIAHARLLHAIRWRAEVVRNRNAKPKLLKLDDCRWPRESKLETRNSKLVAAHDVQKKTRNDDESNFDFRISSFEFQSAIGNHQ